MCGRLPQQETAGLDPEFSSMPLNLSGPGCVRNASTGSVSKIWPYFEQMGDLGKVTWMGICDRACCISQRQGMKSLQQPEAGRRFEEVEAEKTQADTERKVQRIE